MALLLNTQALAKSYGASFLFRDVSLSVREGDRIGLIGPKVSADKAHKELLALLPSDSHVLYNFHIGMLKHGQKICVWNVPKCSKCVLTHICDYFQAEGLPKS